MIVSIITFLLLLLVFYLAWRDIVWGVSFLVFLLPLYLMRLEIFGVPTTMLELGIYVVAVVYFWRLYQKKVSFRWNQFFTLALVLLVLVLLNVIFVSDDKISSLGLWKGWFFDPILLMVIVVGSLRNRAQLEMLRLGFLYLIGLLGLVALVQFVFGVAHTPDGRVSAFFSSANYLAMLLWPGLLISLVQMYKRGRWLMWEILFWLSGLLALLLSASYIGIFSFVLGLLIFALVVGGGNIKKFIWVGVLVALVVAGFIFTQIGSERLSSMIDLSQRSSVTVRLQVWRIDWEMIADNTWWGIGLGNYEEKYLDYAPKLFHPPMEWRMLHAHNLFLHTWVELGLVGLLSLMAIIISWWQLLVRSLKSKINYWWSLSSFIVLVGWIVGGMLDTPYYKNDFSVMFWLLVGVSVVALYKNLYDEKENC